MNEQTHGAVLVVKAAGPLTADEAGDFKERLLAASARVLGRVVLDASAVPFVDSAGVEALADVTEQFGEVGRTLKLLAPSATVRQVLELTGWIDSMEIYDDVNIAVRSYL